MICIVDGSRGIYVPQAFAQMYNNCAMSEDMRKDFDTLLKGPNAEGNEDAYWYAWDEVLDNFTFKGKDGREFSIMQDQDVFAYDPSIEVPDFS